MSSINPYASYLSHYYQGLSTSYRKTSWQKDWVDHSDLAQLNKNAPAGTRWVAVPMHEASAQYSHTAIPNTKTQLEAFNNLQSIGGQSVLELRAVNNVLTFDTGSFYRYNIGNGQSVILSAYGGRPSIAYEGVASAYGTDIGVFTTGTQRAFAHIELLMQALSGYPIAFEQAFTKSERLELYAQVGIEAGDWVEVQNGDTTTRFFLDENGNAWSEKICEQTRQSLNSIDWRNYGKTSEDIFLINGEEYRIDENGHLNVPEGVPCVWNTTIQYVKAGETGAQDNPENNDHTDVHLDIEA